MGVLLGLTRTHARSPKGRRADDLTPFYRGEKVTVIGAISLKKVVAVMTLNGKSALHVISAWASEQRLVLENGLTNVVFDKKVNGLLWIMII